MWLSTCPLSNNWVSFYIPIYLYSICLSLSLTSCECGRKNFLGCSHAALKHSAPAFLPSIVTCRRVKLFPDQLIPTTRKKTHSSLLHEWGPNDSCVAFLLIHELGLVYSWMRSLWFMRGLPFYSWIRSCLFMKSHGSWMRSSCIMTAILMFHGGDPDGHEWHPHGT